MLIQLYMESTVGCCGKVVRASHSQLIEIAGSVPLVAILILSTFVHCGFHAVIALQMLFN